MQPALGCMMIERTGAMMAWLYLIAGLLGSFTADLCVVYNSPVTAVIDASGIVAYFNSNLWDLQLYFSKESSEATIGMVAM